MLSLSDNKYYFIEFLQCGPLAGRSSPDYASSRSFQGRAFIGLPRLRVLPSPATIASRDGIDLVVAVQRRHRFPEPAEHAV